MSIKCADCKFFEKSDEDFGTCRRYAPRPKSGAAGTICFAQWPIVEVEERCGEFEPR